jgi:hypothetical protein
MKYFLNPFFTTSKNQIINIIINFNSTGILFGDGKRNKIKLFELNDRTINIKSFKAPNLINKIVYNYFRKSKARRSFEYATFLLEKGIGTPQPIAYFENHDFIGLKDSYFVSEHLDCDLTFRELVEILDYPDHLNILKQFTQFCYLLHEKGIEFLDHSPGNTLIKKTAEGDYSFYLVDLNRMSFHSEMSFDSRMKNLSRLTPKIEMIQEISTEYARLSGENPNLVFDTLWRYTSKFQYKYYRKIRIKKKLKFWKK